MNIHTKLRLGLVAAFVLLTGLGLLSHKRVELADERAASLAHTHEALAALDSLSAAAHAAESNERGYLLTHAQGIEAVFHDAQADVMLRLAQVNSLAAANPAQKVQLDRLKPLLEQALATQEAYLVNSKTNPQKVWLNYSSAAARDQEQMGQIQACFREMKRNSESFLVERNRSSQKASALAAVFAYVGTLLGAAFVAIGALWISHDLRRCEEAESALHQVREQLEERVRERTADLSRTTASLEAHIAERQQTEEQLRGSEQRYRLIFEDSPLPMEVFDPETLAYLAVNTAAAELYGYEREEFKHMTLRDIRPPEEVPAFLNYLDTVKTADSYSGTFLTRHKSGRLITIEARVRTVEFGGRKARLKLVTDISEKKRLETELQQSQKMEAVGRLAGGIAHDFNNLLMVILGYSDNILHKLDDADPLRDKVSEIHAAAQRAANLTSQLLAFSRKQILRMQTVQLNAIVANISQMLRRLLGEDVEIALNLDEDLGQVLADPAQLEQVLVNLSVNARDAMPHGGQLDIETHNVELDEQTAPLQGVPVGDYVLLTVSDTGCGMDESVRSKIFEPFFTTKEVGKGTGLGLAMVFGVVQQSGGAITVSSDVGFGTTFKIYLPRLNEPVAAPPAPEPAPKQAGETVYTPAEVSCTILLVEDEKQLRTLAREVLKEAGYRVLEAGNGLDALRLAEALAAPPSLLLTDVVMPEMSGLQLAEALQGKWPELAVLYTSGYTEHALLGRNGWRGDMPFLQKPYMPGQLLEQVAQVLECEPSVPLQL